VSKNVAVFVDVANIFYAAKAAGVDIDYVTLLKSATAGRDFIRAYAYTGLDPENENQRQFQNFLGRNGYKVVSKDIRKYGDGKVKANLDIELVVDMMKTARNVDIAVVVSGDGDFAPAIRAVQEMGVRVEVISFRGNTSSDLIEVADTFTDITQLAKVEKSSRSGRRVAASAEDDLSMTAVPDKETEGAPRRRRRTTKPASDDAALAEVGIPVAAAPRTRAPRGTGTRTPVARTTPIVAARSAAEAIAAAGMTAPLRVLPGEHLSRVVTTSPEVATPADLPVAAVADVGDLGDLADAAGEAQGTSAAEAPLGPETVGTESSNDLAAEPALEGQAVAANGEVPAEGEARRRRRRRGGRGRGRGRGRDREGVAHDGLAREGVPGEAVSGEGSSGEAFSGGRLPREAASPAESDESAFDGENEAEPVPYAPFRPPQTVFGSVWDAQLGMNVPSRPAADTQGLEGEEDLEEPAIPEYLLAERRRGGQQPQGGRGGGIRGRGGRGGRGAYAAALDRERYGKAGAPSTGWSPDRGGRPDRGPRRDRRPGSFQGQSRPSSFERPPSAEPWSEVPPDLEEQIRAQLATRNQPAPAAGPARSEPQRELAGEPQRESLEATPAATTGPDPVHTTTTRRRPSATAQRRPARSRPAAGSAAKAGIAAATRSTEPTEAKASPTARRGRGRTAADPGDQPGSSGTEAQAAAKTAANSAGRRRAPASASASAPGAAAAEAPKRRPRARKTPEA
jgi:uncharacterized LabA/DUF88 family protein